MQGRPLILSPPILRIVLVAVPPVSPTRRSFILVSALAILMPSNTSQKCSANRTESGENHVSYERSATCSEESIDAAALLLFDVLASGIVITIPTSASTAAAATTAVSSFVVLVVVALVVLILSSAIDRLVLF